MRESVSTFLNGSSAGHDLDRKDVECDKLNDCEILFAMDNANHLGTGARLLAKLRAIGSAIYRSHAYAVLFEEFQTALNISKKIELDVRTRFDSTLPIFESVLLNKAVLLGMQERGRMPDKTWPTRLHLLPGYFHVFSPVVKILEPLREVTEYLSSSKAWVGDLL